MQKIKDFLKKINVAKALGFALAWVALILTAFYIFHTNDTVSTADNGNVAIYPSVWKSIWLFLGHGSNWIWGIVSLILSVVFGTIFAIMTDDLANVSGGLIGGLVVSAIFSIVVVYTGGNNIGAFTHHTITGAEYKALKDKNHVDYFFHDANQADSLFLPSFGKEAK